MKLEFGNERHIRMIKNNEKTVQEMIQEEIEEEGEEEISGYECLACGHIQEDDSWGGQCERCIASALSPLYV